MHAADGNEAVDLYRKRRFDAVLMDCEMPVMDGFAATRLIREHEARDRSAANADHRAHGERADRRSRALLAQGMDDYLSKPIELRQLSLLVAKWLGEPASDCDANADARRRDIA